MDLEADDIHFQALLIGLLEQLVPAALPFPALPFNDCWPTVMDSPAKATGRRLPWFAP